MRRHACAEPADEPGSGVATATERIVPTVFSARSSVGFAAGAAAVPARAGISVTSPLSSITATFPSRHSCRTTLCTD